MISAASRSHWSGCRKITIGKVKPARMIAVSWSAIASSGPATSCGVGVALASKLTTTLHA